MASLLKPPKNSVGSGKEKTRRRPKIVDKMRLDLIFLLKMALELTSLLASSL